MDAISERAVLQKNTLRLIPFLFMLYIFAYLDRVNVSVAKLGMKDVPGLDEAAFGFGMGIFFIGYFFFEVPSNLILARVGARRWIARIMVSWGIISMAMILTKGPASFYFLRFLLGVAEAGFFPGIILYLTFWFTAKERARIISLFMTATVIAGVIGNPISGGLLNIKGLGLAGWQWLFLLEGLPSVVLGFVVLLYLPNGPADAKWLSPPEREWMQIRMAADMKSKAKAEHASLKSVFANPMVWLLCFLYMSLVISMYGINFFLPTILKDKFGVTDATVGWLAAVPNLCAAVGMVFIGIHSDKTGERRGHVGIPAFIGAIGLVLVVLAPSPALVLLAFCVTYFGAWGTLGPFWSLPTSFLSGTAAAGGIAWINSVGNLGGFLGPYIMGYLKKATSSYQTGLLILAGSLTLGAILALAAHNDASHKSYAPGLKSEA